MRGTRIGLFLLFATAAGCAGLDSGGYGETYNGFPLPWLLGKAPPQSRTDTLVQHPEYTPASRFSQQPVGSTTAVNTTEMVEENPPATPAATPSATAEK
jgi:hypothetical protein